MILPHGFEAKVRRFDNTAVIDLVGEVNAGAATALNAAYAEAQSGRPASIALNFSRVSYINSTGIALIVVLLAQARKSGCPILAYGLSSHYQEVFRITRLADYMKIYPDEASALPMLAPSGV